MFESIIDAGTVQAFRETEYRVHGDEPFTLKVGETCSALAAAHKRHRVECSAYITACNPFSQIFGKKSVSALDEEGEFAVERSHLQKRLTVLQIEARELVT